MSTSDFLKEMEKIGEEHGRQRSSISFVTQMVIEFGFYLYVDGHDKMAFWKVCEDRTEAPVIKAELQARLNEFGITEEPDYAMHIWADRNVIGRDASDWDNSKVYSRWQWRNKDKSPTCFTLIEEQILKNDFPLDGKKFWGRYIFKSNPYHVALGEAGKKKSKKDGKMYWPSFVLPVEKFANEKAAKAFMDGQKRSSNIKWSATALAAFGDEGPMESLQEEILKWLNEAKKGNYYANDKKNYPELPDRPTESEARAYIAGIYEGIETEDIKAIETTLIPF